MQRNVIICISFLAMLLVGCSDIEKVDGSSFLEKLGNTEKSSSVNLNENIEDAREELSSIVDTETDAIAKKNADEVYEELKKKNDSEFYGALDSLTATTGEESSNGYTLAQRLWLWFYSTYATVRKAAPIIAAFSILIGAFIFIFSRKNKAMRRFGLYGLIILIPLILVIYVYGVGILNGVFLY